MSSELNINDTLDYKSQGLSDKAISKVLGCEESEVTSIVKQGISELSKSQGENVASAFALELLRLDKLISLLFDDLSNVDDLYCEVTGKLVRDAVVQRRAIIGEIRKVVETKAKLIQSLAIYSKDLTNTTEAESDVKNMTLSEKLTLFRDLLS